MLPPISGFKKPYKAYTGLSKKLSLEIFRSVDNYMKDHLPTDTEYKSIAETVSITDFGASSSLCYYKPRNSDSEQSMYWHYDSGLNNSFFAD